MATRRKTVSTFAKTVSVFQKTVSVFPPARLRWRTFRHWLAGGEASLARVRTPVADLKFCFHPSREFVDSLCTKGFRRCWDAENTPKEFHLPFTPPARGREGAILCNFLESVKGRCNVWKGPTAPKRPVHGLSSPLVKGEGNFLKSTLRCYA